MEALAVCIIIGLIVLLIVLIEIDKRRRASVPSPPPSPPPSSDNLNLQCTIIGSVSSGKTLMLCSIHKAFEQLAEKGQVKGTTYSEGVTKRLTELQESGVAAPTPPGPVEWLETRVNNRFLRFQAIAGEDLYNAKREMSARDLLTRYDGQGKVIVVAINPFVVNKQLAAAGMHGLLNASLRLGQTISQAATQAMRVVFSVSTPNSSQQRSIAKLSKIDAELQSRELSIDERGYVIRSGNVTPYCIRPVLDKLVNTVCGEATNAHLNVLRAVVAEAQNPCVATTHIDLLKFVQDMDSAEFRNIAESLFGNRPSYNHQIIAAAAVSMKADVGDDDISFRVSLLPDMGSRIFDACEKVLS